jgi:hypothetical protein
MTKRLKVLLIKFFIFHATFRDAIEFLGNQRKTNQKGRKIRHPTWKNIIFCHFRSNPEHTCQLSRFRRDFPDFDHPSRFPDRDFQNPQFSRFSKSISRFTTLRQSTTNCQPKVKIPRPFVTPANQNRDKQSPLLHVYLMQRVKTIWTRVII